GFPHYDHDVGQTVAGVPQNSVLSIVQTADGYLWLGTQEGLVRFDGVQFTVYDKANTAQIKKNWVRTIHEDRKGNLWIGTYGGGLSRLRDGVFTTYTTQDGLSSNNVFAIDEDAEGNLWIGTYGGGLSRFREGKFTTYTTKQGLANDSVRSVYQDREGSLWVGTDAGLSRLRGGEFTTYTLREGLAADRVLSIHEDREGNLWIGTSGGLNRLRDGKFFTYTTKQGLSEDIVMSICEDREGNLWFGTYGGGVNLLRNGVFTSFTTQFGLSNDRVMALYEDREGSLWIGTNGGGLDRFKDARFSLYTKKDGLSHEIVRSIYEDHEGNLWIGTAGGGVNLFREGEFTAYTSREGLSNDDVFSIDQDEKGNLWLGTYGGGVNLFKEGAFTAYTSKDGLSSDYVFSIHVDGEGSLWIGTQGGGLNRLKDGEFSVYTTQQGLSNNTVLSIYEDRAENLWIGTDEGLNRFKNGEFRSYTIRDGLSSDTIFALYEDKEGELWIGTDTGLNRFREGKFTSFTTKEGLSANVIYQILEDDKDNLWMSSIKGIFRVSKKELRDFERGEIPSITAISYGKSDGLKSSECTGGTQPAGARTRDGRLWFPTLKGLAMIDPDDPRTNKLVPPVWIEQVVIDGKPVDLREVLEIPPGKEKLEFHYTALSFLAPEKIRFQFKLEGFEKDWVNAGRRRVAYYTSIPPGNYRFRVIACNNDGLWNEAGASLGFELEPYFYQTSPFYILTGVALLLMGLAMHRIKVKRLKARERELAWLVKERTGKLVEEKEKTEEALTQAEEAKKKAERHEKTIKEHRQRLIEMDKVKTRFFANVSHEFRTPLTLTIGPLEDALSGAYGQAEGEMREQLEMMLRNSRRLLRLVNQLLDISKLEAGKMELKARSLDLVQFLRHIVHSFSSQAERKNITFQLSCEEERVVVDVDPEKLEKVVFNLLSNAFKFTPCNGKIWLSVSSGSDPEGKESIVICVKDTGSGIPKQELPQIFDRFRQVEDSSGLAGAGTGIGLSLAKDLVELHGGDIRAESQLGFGSEFVVTLPKAQARLSEAPIADQPGQGRETDGSTARTELAGLERAAPRAAEGTVEGPSGAPTILIVDDDPDVREYVKKGLLHLYQVAEAVDGEDGLGRAREIQPDLILSDVMMPKLDGYAFCRALRKDRDLNHIPVILLTAKVSQDMKVEGLEAGADEYLAKPFNRGELLARVKNLIQMRRQEKELKAFNEQLQEKVRKQLETVLKSQRLAKYFPPALLERILASEEEAELLSERRKITLFFSDLTNFTDLTDRTAPEQITSVLNDYMTEMLKLIGQYEGVFEKLMGDGIMAFFGAPERMGSRRQAKQAVSMAVAMQKKMKELGRKWVDAGLDHKLRIRIGIHQDYVTVGNFGSRHLVQYGAIGGGVNAASRLESSCTPGRILVSFPVYSLTKDDFPYGDLEERDFKGFARPIKVCELDPNQVTLEARPSGGEANFPAQFTEP
ncbi:MAG: two-component regulator propeller domain-containing protein, partial [Acidobacteriota bacterium]